MELSRESVASWKYTKFSVFNRNAESPAIEAINSLQKSVFVQDKMVENSLVISQERYV